MARRCLALVAASLACSCGDSSSSAGPNEPLTVRIVYIAMTVPRTDMPPSTEACRQGVGATHTHPSWRGYAGFPLQANGPERWEITFDDVPPDVRHSLRINDGNHCDENPTGASTRNVFANDVLLTDVVATPGPEPGLAFTVARDGRVTP